MISELYRVYFKDERTPAIPSAQPRRSITHYVRIECRIIQNPGLIMGAPMGGMAKNNLCDMLSFLGLFIWKMYLNNRFKTSGELL